MTLSVFVPVREPVSALGRQANQATGRSAARVYLGRIRRTLIPVLISGLFALPAAAQHDASIFRDADMQSGEKLIVEHRCNACHIRKFGGDGTQIYRPQGRINTAGFLRGMVEQCNTELKLQLWPEDVTAIAAVLNRDFYRFK